ncbi:MAG: PD40 domain-containing protein, partial [Acidobacteria bacterium]|nr:PD40 domain-containing protein [Acidobacteriota bacterium]
MLGRIALVVTVLAWAATVAAAEAPYTLQDEKQAQFADLQRAIQQFKDGRWKPPAAQAFRPEALILAADRDPLDVVLRRTAALLAHVGGMPAAPDLSAERSRLDALIRQAAGTDGRLGDRTLFDPVLDVRRKIAFASPLLDFGRILFIKRQFLPPAIERGNHMCDQYFGFHAIAGGGVFVLEEPFSDAPAVRDVLAGAVCENGRFKGRPLAAGGFLSPDLSYDGRTILFAWTEAEPTRYVWTERSTFHIFKVNADGSGLVQLTDGAVNDFDPCWLPNGRIAFISERRDGYGRCHARPVPIFTLHT